MIFDENPDGEVQDVPAAAPMGDEGMEEAAPEMSPEAEEVA